LRGKIAAILIVLSVAAVYSIFLSNSTNDRMKRDAEVMSLMTNYSAETASIYEGGWTGADGSVPGKYTLHITKDGSIYSCRQVSIKSLRDSEPIKCDGGMVIQPKP
jgi:hypothetical protein